MSVPLCPSFAAVPGALLLGRLAEDGKVEILRTPMPVTSGFLDALREREVEADAAYRFAGPCYSTSCSRWGGGKCQLAAKVASVSLAEEQSPDLPDCGIRESCRWYSQQGAAACPGCVFIVRRHPENRACQVPEQV